MPRPRLLFVCTTLSVGGFERHLAHLVPDLRHRGYDPAVIVLRHPGEIYEELREQGIRACFADMRSRTDVRGLRRAVLAAADPDVVFSQSIDAHIAAAIVARRAPAIHVATEHAAPEFLLDHPLRHRIAYRLVAPRVDQAVAVTRAQVPGMVGLGYRKSAIRVIPNGIPALRPSRSSEEVRGELGLGEGDFVVSLVAVLRPEKRAELFVDAVIAANRAEPSIRAVIVGDGSELERVRARAKGSESIVKVLGARSDIADLIASSDAVALSSVAECLPLAVLEAMALGRPVVGTDVGGMSELITQGETGRLVPPGDTEALATAIVELARNPDLAGKMGLMARRRYERMYTLDTMVEHYAQLVDELMSRRRCDTESG